MYARQQCEREEERQLTVVFGLACRALHAAELRYVSASGRFMHRWCVVCGKAALSPEGEKVVALGVLGALVVVERGEGEDIILNF